MFLPLLKMTILIINFPSTNLKIAMEIENFKKDLMSKNAPFCISTKEIENYASTNNI